MIQENKIPPQAVDFEEIVLGSIMLSNDLLISVADILKPDFFYTILHQKICRCILDLFNNNNPVNIVTVTNKLRQTGELESVGGAFYITQLTTKSGYVKNLEYYVRILDEKFRQRELIRIASEILNEAFEENCDVFDLSDKIDLNLIKINLVTDNKVKNLNELSKETFKDIEFLKNNPKEFTGTPSGFTSIDRITGGWQKSDLIIMAGRPGMGKTTFALNCILNSALLNKKCGIFSLEMSKEQLIRKILSKISEICLSKINSGNLSDYEIEKLREVSKNITSNIYIDDTAGLSTQSLRSKCIRLKKKHDIDIIMVDYIQLMKASTMSKSDNREREISIISQTIKNIAKELNIPVIALSQLSREVEKRPMKRPRLSDLRESGALENDSDIVIFLWRPEYYKYDSFEFKDLGHIDSKGKCVIDIAKGRNIGLAEILLNFDGATSSFFEEENFNANEAFESFVEEKNNVLFPF